MKKRLMMLLLATTFAFSTVAMTGCGDDSSKSSKSDKDDDDDDDKDSKKNKKSNDDDDDDKDSKKNKKSNDDDDDDDDDKGSKKKSNDDDDDDDKDAKKKKKSESEYESLEDFNDETDRVYEEIDDWTGGLDYELDIDDNTIELVVCVDDNFDDEDEFFEYAENIEENGADMLEEEFEEIADRLHEESGIDDTFKLVVTIVSEDYDYEWTTKITM